jgi:hypothetical protein
VCSLIGFLAGAGFRAVEQVARRAGIVLGTVIPRLIATAVIRRIRARRTAHSSRSPALSGSARASHS